MKAQQLELDGAAQVFNLAAECTQDGAQAAARLAQEEKDRLEGEKAQKPLFELELPKPTS